MGQPIRTDCDHAQTGFGRDRSRRRPASRTLRDSLVKEGEKAKGEKGKKGRRKPLNCYPCAFSPFRLLPFSPFFFIYDSSTNTQARRFRDRRDAAPLHRVVDMEPSARHAPEPVAARPTCHSSQPLPRRLVSRKSL